MFTCLGIARDSRDIVSAKDKDVPPMRPDEVVAEFVNENLVAGIDGTAGDDITFLVTAPGQHFEILPQGVRGRVDEIVLLLADQLRKGEEEAVLLRNDLH